MTDSVVWQKSDNNGQKKNERKRGMKCLINILYLCSLFFCF